MLELPKMHQYYQNTALTLVIESVKGDHEGFIKSLNARENVMDGVMFPPTRVSLDVRNSSLYLNTEDDGDHGTITTAENF